MITRALSIEPGIQCTPVYGDLASKIIVSAILLLSEFDKYQLPQGWRQEESQIAIWSVGHGGWGMKFTSAKEACWSGLQR